MTNATPHIVSHQNCPLVVTPLNIGGEKMTDIYLNLERLKSEIITLTDKKLAETDKAMRSACNAAATLTASGWEGDSKGAFMERFTKHKNDMKICHENIKELNKQLKTIHAEGRKLLAQGNKVATKL